MPRLLLRAMDQAARDERATRLAALLWSQFDREDTLSQCRVAGPTGQRRVEVVGGDPVALIGLLLATVRTGDWATALVLGSLDSEFSDAEGIRHDERRLDAVLRRAARSSGRCAVEAAPGSDGIAAMLAESVLQLLGALERRRSEQQQEAGRLVESGASQREAAADLGVTQQAVHERLRNGLWNETRRLAADVAVLVTRAEAPAPRSGVTG